MTKAEETAAAIIDECISAIRDEYPDLKPKVEYLLESEDASILYGESYYNLEVKVASMLEKFHKEQTTQTTDKADERNVRKIEFRGLDDWNRPVFKVLVDPPYYIGSVDKLFDYTDSKETIENYFKNRFSQLVYFGQHFNCEPAGGILSDKLIWKLQN